MATSKRREQQQTDEFKERYKIRSGIEATISEANQVTGFKRVWTRGKDRVAMSVFMKALAINVKRFVQTELSKAKETFSYSFARLSQAFFSLLTPLSALRREFCPFNDHYRYLALGKTPV